MTDAFAAKPQTTERTEMVPTVEDAAIDRRVSPAYSRRRPATTPR